MDRRLRIPDPFKRTLRSAHLDAFSLHAGVRIHENDREAPERLCTDPRWKAFLRKANLPAD